MFHDDSDQQQDDLRYRSQKATPSSMSRVSAFQVSVNNLIPITNMIKQENRLLNQQKQRIQKELTQLGNLSSMLAQQNEAMRQHFQQRKIDLQQLISSFVLNSKEDISDIDHLVYSYREHNRMLNTQIDSLDKQVRSSDESNCQLKQKLEQLTIKNIQLQKGLMSRQARTQRNTKVLQEEKQMVNSVVKLDGLQKQVADLCLQIRKMKIFNKTLLVNLRNEMFQVGIEKPAKKQQTVQKIKEKVLLQSKMEVMKDKIGAIRSARQHVEQINEQLVSKLKSAYAQNEKRKLAIGVLCDKIRKSQQLKQKSLEQVQKWAKQVQAKQQIKLNLMKQLDKLNYVEQQRQEAVRMRKLEIQKEGDKKIGQIKQEIQKISSNLNHELGQNTFVARKQNEKTLSNLRYELSIVENRSKQLEKTLSAIKDPIKQIKMMEAQLSKTSR